MTVDIASGDLILTDLSGITVSSLFSGNTLGTAYNAITIIDNIDNFIIPAGAIVYVLGTVVVEAAGQIVIDGTLNGDGGRNILLYQSSSLQKKDTMFLQKS